MKWLMRLIVPDSALRLGYRVIAWRYERGQVFVMHADGLDAGYIETVGGAR